MGAPDKPQSNSNSMQVASRLLALSALLYFLQSLDSN